MGTGQGAAGNVKASKVEFLQQRDNDSDRANSRHGELPSAVTSSLSISISISCFCVCAAASVTHRLPVAVTVLLSSSTAIDALITGSLPLAVTLQVQVTL